MAKKHAVKKKSAALPKGGGAARNVGQPGTGAVSPKRAAKKTKIARSNSQRRSADERTSSKASTVRKGNGSDSRKDARPPAAVRAATPASAAQRTAAEWIVARLADAYPTAHCALHFRSPLELLIATILSAQCTDQRVNLVTPALFRKYPTAADYAAAAPEELRRDIQSTGFFNAKAKSIQGACQALADRFGGQVPRDLASLVALPGVGRKTANVVLGTAFGLPTGVVVDTHVARLSQRLGLTRQSQPEKIETDLMHVLPQAAWIAFSHRMIEHGRKVCAARRPQCDNCPLSERCPRIGVDHLQATARERLAARRSSDRRSTSGAMRAELPAPPQR